MYRLFNEHILTLTLYEKVGRKLGLTDSTYLVKRAIQFGSRIAKLQNTAAAGGSKKVKGSHAITTLRRD